jgi:hypothetical protein
MGRHENADERNGGRLVEVGEGGGIRDAAPTGREPSQESLDIQRAFPVEEICRGIRQNPHFRLTFFQIPLTAAKTQELLANPIAGN